MCMSTFGPPAEEFAPYEVLDLQNGTFAGRDIPDVAIKGHVPLALSIEVDA